MKVWSQLISQFVLGALLSLWTPQTHANTGKMELEAMEQITASQKKAEELCHRLKVNPNCPEDLSLMQKTLGLSVATCFARMQSPSCQDFVRKYPDKYGSHLLSCQPADICNTALVSNIATGCKRFGLEAKNDFLAKMYSLSQCSQNLLCLTKVEFQSLMFLFAPQIKAQELTEGIIKDFQKDYEKAERISCLDAETQAQFMCYLGFKYGSMVLGPEVGGEQALGKLLLSQMEKLDALLAEESGRIALAALAKPKYPTFKMLKKFRGEDVKGLYKGLVPDRKVKYFTDAQREATRLTFKDGRVLDAEGKPLKLKVLMYVMDNQGNFYAAEQVVGRRHHSSFFAGGPVAAAGEIYIENGKVLAISRKSGHYVPPVESLLNAVKELRQRGVEVDPKSVLGASDFKEFRNINKGLNKTSSQSDLKASP